MLHFCIITYALPPGAVIISFQALNSIGLKKGTTRLNFSLVKISSLSLLTPISSFFFQWAEEQEVRSFLVGKSLK